MVDRLERRNRSRDRGAGVPVTDVAELTGLPAILGHRVVTLHPKIHGGILADPTDAEHVADMAHHGIEPIDLVVVNLYPFSSDPASS
jgi:phosphoribosylaminoimidazolecarboxamide formyltransferase / IMP cyclohydrolase